MLLCSVLVPKTAPFEAVSQQRGRESPFHVTSAHGQVGAITPPLAGTAVNSHFAAVGGGGNGPPSLAKLLPCMIAVNVKHAMLARVHPVHVALPAQLLHVSHVSARLIFPMRTFLCHPFAETWPTLALFSMATWRCFIATEGLCVDVCCLSASTPLTSFLSDPLSAGSKRNLSAVAQERRDGVMCVEACIFAEQQLSRSRQDLGLKRYLS